MACLENNKGKLYAAAKEYVIMLESNPERVTSFFQDQNAKYAA
jgi:hypothetical protein